MASTPAAPSPSPTRYDRRQVGAWMRWSFLAVAVGSIVVLAAVDLPGSALLLGVLAAALFLAVGWTFSSLRVVVDERAVHVAFGAGWPRKAIPLEEIAAAEVTRNVWWWGFGIRWTGEGWLWNVAGLDAVLLRRTKGRVFRIGTDDPQGLCDAIEAGTRSGTRAGDDASPDPAPGLAS